MSDKYYVRMKFIIAIYLDFAQRKFASEKFPTAEILYFHVNIHSMITTRKFSFGFIE